jgi:dolichyl-phosphate-mannose-protein mannosyltransferase
VRVDSLWRNGLAGAIPSAVCFVLAGSFLFAAVRRVFDSRAAASTAVALFALNPNILYLQSIPMTESVFFACFMALFYFTVRFRETQGWGAVAGAGGAVLLATLTRYDAWFLIPFTAAYFLFTAERRRAHVTALFCFLACLGPAFWLFHNWWMTGDALDFFRGPYSPRAIQRNLPYPGKSNWREAFLYYRTAVQLCAGPGLVLMSVAGIVVAVARRAFWPVFLLALPGAFYILSMHSTGGSPIFVPDLPPHSYYNTRYGTALMPLLVLAAAALVTAVPLKIRPVITIFIVAVGAVHWAAHPSPSAWATWEESRRNSEGRRAWTHKAAEFLKTRYRPGSGIITSFGDLTGIWREMGVPLRQTFTGDNGLFFDATVARPDLHLRQEWAVVMGGDPVQTAINRAARAGIRYRLEKTIVEDKEPVIEIYRRSGEPGRDESLPGPSNLGPRGQIRLSPNYAAPTQGDQHGIP